MPPDHTRIRKGRYPAPLRRAATVLWRLWFAKGSVLCWTRCSPSPRGDLVADLAYDLPALTILTLLGVEPGKVAEVKRWAKSRVLLTWGNISDAEAALIAPLAR